jgi:hypothetical protein
LDGFEISEECFYCLFENKLTRKNAQSQVQIISPLIITLLLFIWAIAKGLTQDYLDTITLAEVIVA